MNILDRNKDYYDYLSHIYGIDEHAVFDRRGSALLTDQAIGEFAAAAPLNIPAIPVAALCPGCDQGRRVFARGG